MAITLTRELAFASGADAGNARVRRGAARKWSDADYDVAVSATNRLLMHVPADQGGLMGLNLSAKQLSDLGIA